MAKKADTIRLSSLKPNEQNPRKISDGAFEKLCRSIRRDPKFMELRPIVVDEQHVIIGGNQRYRACLKIGRQVVPTSWVRVAVGLTEEQRKRFVLLDNAPDGMAGYWDWDKLQLNYEVSELESVGFILPEKVDFEKEWQGMPEFISDDQRGYQRIVVHFEEKKDVEAFAKLLKQKITPNTNAIWFPYKPHFDSNALRYKSEP